MFEFYVTLIFVTIVAGYLGALVFGAAAMAPLAVKLLPAASSATLLRAFWLRFHRFGVGVGVAVTLVCGAGALVSALPAGYAALLATTAGLMTACFFVGLQLIPAINSARDAGDGRAFNRLHRTDVMLVGSAIILGIALLAGLIYALPSQFTLSGSPATRNDPAPVYQAIGPQPRVRVSRMSAYQALFSPSASSVARSRVPTSSRAEWTPSRIQGRPASA